MQVRADMQVAEKNFRHEIEQEGKAMGSATDQLSSQSIQDTRERIVLYQLPVPSTVYIPITSQHPSSSNLKKRKRKLEPLPDTLVQDQLVPKCPKFPNSGKSFPLFEITPQMLKNVSRSAMRHFKEEHADFLLHEILLFLEQSPTKLVADILKKCFADFWKVFAPTKYNLVSI